MNKKEFSQLSIGLKAAYPRFQMLNTDEEMTFWYIMLQDIDYKVAQNASLEYISTNTFPPSIAEIRKLCAERMQKPVLPYDEAWGVVQRAMSTYGQQHPQEAFETMDELTLSVVKNLGWSRLCQSENPTADRANFREAYEKKAKAAQNSYQLPKFVAHNKALLQEQYVPAIETKEVRKIERKEPVHDVRETLTKEELAKQAKMLEEARRRILGGKAE